MYFQWKITHFLLANYRILLLGVAFSWSSWKLYLLELIVWFSKQLIIEEALPIPPFIQYQLLWMKISLWCGWWWFILLAPRSLHSTLLYSKFTFHCRSQFIFKKTIFVTFKQRMACRRFCNLLYSFSHKRPSKFFLLQSPHNLDLYRIGFQAAKLNLSEII